MQIQAPKGMKDVLPAESYKWQYLESVLRKTAADFGFTEIRFPTLEHTELFERGMGDTTDVVNKEMYTFLDKSGRSVTMRPEGTASVVRAFIQHGLAGAGLPLKCFYIAPNFRYEKPQAGRVREHHQFGVECFGAALPSADAEVISVADTYLRRLGIHNIKVHLNSIGCPDCRKVYHAALKDYFRPYLDKLCETCRVRFEKNPLRLLDCKSEVCGKIAANAPRTIDYLDEPCAVHFEAVKTYLDEMGVPYEIDTGIVRGLDYYTRTVFEFISEDIDAANKAVCAGGRYDGLVEALGGGATPGLGFGSGLERLLLVMEALGVDIPAPGGIKVFLAAQGNEADMPVQKLILRLRQLGISAERDTTGRSLKAQMKYADRIGVRYSAVIGGEELERGIIRLKDMQNGEVREVGLTAAAVAAALEK